MQLRSELKSILSYEIEHVFGRRIISSRDCIDLGQDIFIKTKLPINPNTLRRFFGIIKAEYPASQATLIILAKYCGFHNLEEINRAKKAENPTSASIDPESMLHYLVSMFRGSFVKEAYDETFLNLVIHSIKFLNANKFLADRFQSEIAQTGNGIHYYFEQLVNVDKLNSFYGNGLRHYLREKGTMEAEMFSSALQTFKYWLNGDDDKLVKNAELMLACGVAETLSPHLHARQMAATLFYYHSIHTDTENLRINISHFLTDIHQSCHDSYSVSQACYTLCEALLLTGYSGDTLHYIRQFRKAHDAAIPDNGLLSYAQNYNLLEAYSLWNTGDGRLAEKKFNEIRSSDFSFLNKKFSGILYLSLLKRMKPKDKKHEEQFLALVSETGFERLQSFLPVNKLGKSM